MSHRAKDYWQTSSSANSPWTDFFFPSLGNISHEIQAAILFNFFFFKLEKQWVLLVEVTWSFFFFFSTVCCMACPELGKILAHVSMEQMKQLSWSLDRESFVNFSNVMWWWGGKSGTHWICGYIFNIHTHICRTQATIWYLTNNTSVDTGWINGSTKIGH